MTESNDASRDLSLLKSFDSQIPGSFSYLLSPQSEPPDVRNWFSSYKYESPSQESSLTRLDSESCGLEGDCDGTAMGLRRGFRKQGVEDSAMPPIEGADGEKKCFKTRASESLPAEEERKTGAIRVAANIENISPKRITINEFHQEKSSERNDVVPLNENHTLLPKIKRKHILDGYGKECSLVTSKASGVSAANLNDNQQCQSTSNTCHKKMIDMDGAHNFSKALGDGKESPDLGTYISKDRILSRCSDGQENHVAFTSVLVDKENSKADNGRWVSTRNLKDSLENVKESRKPYSVLKLKNAKLPLEGYGPLGKRAALADKTNLVEVAAAAAELPNMPGKWQCPSRNKPNLGPPLKQLRLERWVHRVIDK